MLIKYARKQKHIQRNNNLEFLINLFYLDWDKNHFPHRDTDFFDLQPMWKMNGQNVRVPQTIEYNYFNSSLVNRPAKQKKKIFWIK